MTEHLFLAGCAFVELGRRTLAKKQRQTRRTMDAEAELYWGTDTQVQARILETLDTCPEGLRLPEIFVRINDALPKDATTDVVQVALNHLANAKLVYSVLCTTDNSLLHRETYWYIIPLGTPSG